MPPLAETIHEVRQAILQEQTAREKLIFALLHPATGEGHHAVGHPVGQHLAELHKLVMAPELRDERNLNSDTEAGRKLFKDAMHVGSSGDILVMPASQEFLGGDHGRYDPKSYILHLEYPDHAASPDDHTRTLVHELAHSYIVRANGNQWLQPDPASHANSGRDLDEVVAEGATYIVAKHYGLDTSEKSIGKIHMDSGPGHDIFHDPKTLELIHDTASAVLNDMGRPVGYRVGSPKHEELVASYLQKMSNFNAGELPTHEETQAYLAGRHTDPAGRVESAKSLLSPKKSLEVYRHDMSTWNGGEGHFRAIAEARGETLMPEPHTREHAALVKSFSRKLGNDEAPTYQETKAHFDHESTRPYDFDNPHRPVWELTGEVNMAGIRHHYDNLVHDPLNDPNGPHGLTGDTTGFYQAIEEKRAQMAGMTVEAARKIENYAQIHADRHAAALEHPVNLGKAESAHPYRYETGGILREDHYVDGAQYVQEAIRVYEEDTERHYGSSPSVSFQEANPSVLRPIRLGLRERNADLIAQRSNSVPLSPDHEPITVNDAYKFQDAWSQSVQTAHSIALQQAVMEKFGLPTPDGWEQRLADNRNEAIVPGETGMATDLTIFSRQDLLEYPRTLGKARTYVDAQYDLTQEWYRERGITHLTLFRGMNFLHGYNMEMGNTEEAPPWVHDVPTDGTEMAVEPFPLSSWALDHQVAVRFSEDNSSGPGIGLVFSSQVPVERIFANGITGTGALVESEHVLIGGPATAFVYQSVNNAEQMGEEAAYDNLKETVSNYLGDHLGESYDSLLAEDPNLVFDKLTLYNPGHHFEKGDVYDYINQYGPEPQ